jgi:hypothetical protein
MGKEKSWVSTGTGDTLTCDDMNKSNLHSINIDSDTLDFTTVTITVYNSVGGSKVVTAPAGSGNAIKLDSGYGISKIVLSGVSAGTKLVRFYR